MSVNGVHNSSRGLGAKLEMRRNVLAEMGQARVLECYCGPVGEMTRAWDGAASVSGIDMVWRPEDARRRFVGDTLRILRAIDLGEFNVFDIDAFGAPWPAFETIAKRRGFVAGELVGLVVTDGGSLKLRLGAMGHAQARLLGAEHVRTVASVKTADFLHAQTFRAACSRIGATRRAWTATCNTGRSSGRMSYSAAVIVANGS